MSDGIPGHQCKQPGWCGQKGGPFCLGAVRNEECVSPHETQGQPCWCSRGCMDAYGIGGDDALLPRALARIAELERAAETTRAEHAAALGLATARIRELEGERDELLGLLRRIPKYVREDRAVTPGVTRLARLAVEIEAIVARIEKATKGTT